MATGERAGINTVCACERFHCRCGLFVRVRFHCTCVQPAPECANCAKSETNGLRLVPPLGNLLLLRHVYSACVVTIMLSSITCMVYGGGYEACHQDLYDPTGEQDLDEFDGFDC